MSRRERRAAKIAPEAIFLQGISFHTAFRHLYYDWKPWHPSGKYAVNTPACVLSAFASELFFKTIVVVETGRVPKGHNLLVLFNQMSAATQKRVTELWDQYAIEHANRWVEIEEGMGGLPVARDLPTALKRGGRAFELARYSYERREEFQFYLGALPEMLKRVIFELRPDWKAYAAKGYDDLGLQRPPELKDVDARDWKSASPGISLP
jgi:hypothetical protein